MDEFWKAIVFPLMNTGAVGGILLLILLKFQPALQRFEDGIWTKLNAIEDAIDRANKVDILRLVASPHVSDDVKAAATELLSDTNQASDARRQAVVERIRKP